MGCPCGGLGNHREPPGQMGVSRTALALVVVFAIMDTAGQHRDQVARMAPNLCHCRCRILGRHDSSWRYRSLLKLTDSLLAGGWLTRGSDG
jgi:hypothetical protein